MYWEAENMKAYVLPKIVIAQIDVWQAIFECLGVDDDTFITVPKT